MSARHKKVRKTSVVLANRYVAVTLSIGAAIGVGAGIAAPVSAFATTQGGLGDGPFWRLLDKKLNDLGKQRHYDLHPGLSQNIYFKNDTKQGLYVMDQLRVGYALLDMANNAIGAAQGRAAYEADMARRVMSYAGAQGAWKSLWEGQKLGRTAWGGTLGTLTKGTSLFDTAMDLLSRPSASLTPEGQQLQKEFIEQVKRYSKTDYIPAGEVKDVRWQNQLTTIFGLIPTTVRGIPLPNSVNMGMLGFNTVNLFVMTEDGKKATVFSSAPDNSYIATDSEIVRSKYGTTSVPDRYAGHYSWGLDKAKETVKPTDEAIALGARDRAWDSYSTRIRQDAVNDLRGLHKEAVERAKAEFGSDPDHLEEELNKVDAKFASAMVEQQADAKKFNDEFIRKVQSQIDNSKNSQETRDALKGVLEALKEPPKRSALDVNRIQDAFRFSREVDPVIASRMPKDSDAVGVVLDFASQGRNVNGLIARYKNLEAQQAELMKLEGEVKPSMFGGLRSWSLVSDPKTGESWKVTNDSDGVPVQFYGHDKDGSWHQLMPDSSIRAYDDVVGYVEKGGAWQKLKDPRGYLRGDTNGDGKIDAKDEKKAKDDARNAKDDAQKARDEADKKAQDDAQKAKDDGQKRDDQRRVDDGQKRGNSLEEDHKDSFKEDHKDPFKEDHKDPFKDDHKDPFKDDHKDPFKDDHKD
ncbi:hypothetical protein ACFV2N_47765, partial [Streptomyces sp. NPDC059680]|uniref:hypothetical protein n=1 Tax=Streptomyces sp. NPDC059680 TaxID=3346904 RepID=UPI0036CC9893